MTKGAAVAIQTLERGDLQIQRDVLNELRWDPRLQPNGIVSPAGWEDRYNEKWAADRERVIRHRREEADSWPGL